MPILLKMNLKCNFNCDYCYQAPIRPEEEIIDYKAVENTILDLWEKGGGKDPKTGKINLDKNGRYCGPTITLHGGEPTIMPIKDFERYLKLSHRLTGSSGIQTNGYNITDEMVRMFKKYRTHVGFSIDGPFPLNEFRGIGSLEQKKQQTEQVIHNMNRLHNEGISSSVIAVIHKKNACPERREVFKSWIKELSEKGITGRLNECCTGNSDIDLTIQEAVDFYTDMYDFMIENGYTEWSPFKDIMNSFKGESNVVCSFRGCDPFCTSAATSVLNDGSVGVCLRLYGDGKKYLRTDLSTNIRRDVLSETDCKDCKWWEHCYGGCSGLSSGFDWRNKDRFCELYKVLFEKTEKLMKFMKYKQVKRTESHEPIGDEQHSDGMKHLDNGTLYLDSDRVR